MLVTKRDAIAAGIGPAFEAPRCDRDDVLTAGHRHAAHLMTLGLERRGELVPLGTRLKDHAARCATEIDEARRLRRVHPPVEQAR